MLMEWQRISSQIASLDHWTVYFNINFIYLIILKFLESWIATDRALKHLRKWKLTSSSFLNDKLAKQIHIPIISIMFGVSLKYILFVLAINLHKISKVNIDMHMTFKSSKLSRIFYSYLWMNILKAKVLIKIITSHNTFARGFFTIW